MSVAVRDIGNRRWTQIHVDRRYLRLSAVLVNAGAVTRVDIITNRGSRGAVIAGLGNNPIAWTHTLVGQSFIAGTTFEPFIIKDVIDATSVEGAAELPYAIPNIRVELHSPKIGIPTLWWRSVGHSHNAFVVESFLNELAHAAGKDPVEMRHALLAKHPRNRGVLELAAEKAGWGKPIPVGRGRGISVHESFGSFIAQVAEVSISRTGIPRVHRVVCAIDCGMVVNPDTVKAQMESGIIFGLTAVLYGEITFERGRVQQRNFHDYRMLRINNEPALAPGKRAGDHLDRINAEYCDRVLVVGMKVNNVMGRACLGKHANDDSEEPA